MNDFFYIPETVGLHIPFIGEVSLVKWVLIAAVICLVWALLPKIAEAAFFGFFSMLKKVAVAVFNGLRRAFKSGPVAETPAPAPAAKQPEPVAEAKAAETPAEPEKDIDDPLDSLQDLTEWAVRSGDSDTLSKVTPLFAELQKKLAVGAAMLVACLVAGCSSAQPVDVKEKCGWIGPPPDSSIQSHNQSFRHQAPQLFE